MTRIFARALFILALAMMAAGCTDALKTAGQKVKRAMAGAVKHERSHETVMKKLSNGLAVAVQENHSAPVAAVQVWVKVGAADETESRAGIAHLLEHMVFKGTHKRGVGEIAMEVESMGGDINAFTSHDLTVYHITIASRYWEEAMEILADLVRNAKVDARELEREREVVLEEIRRSMDNPLSRIYKYLFDCAYTEHNYGRPVIGFEETVSSFQREDVLDFYNTWYVAGNMTVVVTGDVSADRVMESVNEYFGDMEDKDPPQRSPRHLTEPEQEELRARVYREDVSDGYFYVGFHIPEFAHQDMAALDVLSSILGAGEVSRLVYRIRTERRLVNKIWSYAYTPRDPGMLLIGMNLTEKKADKALDMIMKQLLLMKHEPVDDWELERAKINIRTETIYARETVDGQARRLGYNVVMTGDPGFEEAYLQEIEAVTKQDVMKAVEKYLAPDNLTAVAIMPDSGENSFDYEKVAAVIETVSEWDRSYRPGALTEPEPISPPDVPGPVKTASLIEPRGAKDPVKFTLKNGVRLVVRENHSVPLVAVRAAFLGGLLAETPEFNGINNFIAETVTEGTASYSASQIHSFIESRAGSINGFSGRNSMGVTLEVPSIYFDSCLPLLGEVIRYPTFPEDEVERIRGIIISSIKSRMDRPAHLAFQLFRSELYREHPYGMDVLGTEASVGRMGRDDLINYYQGVAVPENLVIAVVGDVSANEVRARFEELFEGWVGEEYSPPMVPEPEPPEDIREAVECRDVQQANIVIGFQGTRVSSDGRFPLSVMNSILSGMSGRLFTRLRGEQSLAYSVYAFNTEGVDPGYLGVYIGTAPDKEDEARQGILEELERIRNEPAADEEVERSKRMLIGDFEIGLQRMSSQAAHYALDELYGVGYRASHGYARKIEKVNPRDVTEAARKFIDPGAYVMAVVKPCEAQAGSGYR